MVTYSIQLSHEVEHTLSKRTGLVTTQKNKCTEANQDSNIMIHNSCQQHCCSYNFSLLLHLHVDYTFTSLDLTVNIVDYYRKYVQQPDNKILHQLCSQHFSYLSWNFFGCMLAEQVSIKIPVGRSFLDVQLHRHEAALQL